MENDFSKIDFDESENINTDENKTVNAPPTLLPENSNQAKISLRGPMKLLFDAWQLYKFRWKTFLGIMIVPVLLVIFVFLVFGIIVFGAGMIGAFDFEFATGNIIIFAIGFVLLLALFLVMIIIQFWSQTALIYAIKDSAENIGIKESYKRGWHKIRSFFWVSVLSGFVIMGGYIFFIIPGIIFSIWFSLALYIVIAEDLKGMDALLKSREYIRNYWWSVFWRLLFISLFVYLIIAIIVFFVFLIATLCGITWSLSSDSFEVMVNLPVNIISFILAPLIVIYSFLIYRNLKEIKGDFEFKPSKKSKRLFIVIGLLGFIIIPLFLFSSIVLVSLNSARDKAMDISRRSDISQLQIKLLIYFDEERKYPESLGELDDTGYFKDPKTKKPYEYRQLDNGKDYEICVQFKDERECFSSEDDTYKNPYKYNYDNDMNYTREKTSIDIKKRDTQRISDLLSISSMLNNCKIENGEYPISQTTVKLNGDNSIVSKIKSANENADIPFDSKYPEYYYGYKSLDGKSFELTTRLENINGSGCDAEIKENSGICIYKLRY